MKNNGSLRFLANLSQKCRFLTFMDAYNGISNPIDLNPSVFQSKNQSFCKYLYSK